ncbi:MAG: nucleotide-binding protein [Deltaproteobacteria bacterium]|nr:nucleotide-binding protein [Deltaproteobacteria bacterium]
MMNRHRLTRQVLPLATLACLACSSDEATVPFTPTGAAESGSGVGGAGVGGAGGATPAGSGGDASTNGVTTTTASGSTVCTAGSTRDCYSGPVDTLGIGACKGGKETCFPDGSGFGPCAGEVIPVLETCLTPGDDDCDGKVNEAGDGCVCKPKSTFYCYDGDPKTENVGVCVGGTHTCNDDGTAFGPCIGQLLPQTENCSTTAVDEDCDGKTPLCGPAWQLTAGDAKQQLVNGVAIDASGNTFLVGLFEGSMKLGAITLTSVGLSDAFVAKLDPMGTVQWAFRYGEGVDNQAAQAVAVDAQGNVFVTGYFRASINFGGGALTSAGGSDVFVAKLNGANGAQLWATKYGNAVDDQIGLAITTDAAGNPYVAGTFAGALTFNQTVTAVGLQDAFVARLNGANGTATWSTRFGGADNDFARDIALDVNGNVVVIGDFAGTVALGGATLTTAGLSDIVVARLNGANGTAATPTRFGGTGFDFGRSVITTPTGAYVGGEFEGTVDFQGGAVKSAGGFDMFLVEFATAGNVVQSKTFGGAGDESILALGLDSMLNVLLAGYTTGSINLGSGPVTSAGGRDILAAALSPQLKATWTRRFGDSSFYQQAAAIAGSSTNGIVLGGQFSGTIDLGTGPTMSAGGTDAFAVSFPP